MKTGNSLAVRWIYLAVGVFTMLFSGVLYAWSILKIPFKEVFAWSDSALAFNFTLTMCFFCLGAFAGMQIFRHKTKHLRFQILVPLFLVLHIVALVLAFLYL